MPPNATVPSPNLIPQPEAVQARLIAVCREARILRRLLRLAREAGLPLNTASQLRTPAGQGVARG